MNVTSIYPVIQSDSVSETAAFYRDHFGFNVVFACDWYVSLSHAHAENQELGIIRFDHETVPEASRTPTRGLLVNFEVEDARAEYERLVEKGGMKAVLPIRDEPSGQRHFMLYDPSGNLVDVIENIEPSAEFAANFTS